MSDHNWNVPFKAGRRSGKTQAAIEELKARINEAVESGEGQECIEGPDGEPLWHWRCPECERSIWVGTLSDDPSAPHCCPLCRYPYDLEPVITRGFYGLAGVVEDDVD